MFETVYDFLTTVPVSSPVLRAFIMLGEIFVLAAVLYWVWEQVPSLFGRVRGFLSRPRTTVYGAGELDKAHFADLTSESN